VRRALSAAAFLILTLVVSAAEAPAACPGCLRAGAARVALAIPPGTPLAGYGDFARRLLVPDVLGRRPHAFWFRPHEGTLDPLAARALVLEGDGHRLTWVSADLIAVDAAFTARVERALADAGLPASALIVSASHTHSGPGAFMESGFLGVVSIERRDREVRDALVDSLVQAVRRADAAKTPARVASASLTAHDLTTGRLGLPVDAEMVVLKIDAESGAPIATVWNYAIHGTMLPPFNLRLSADVMGVANRELERVTGAPALFVNGAVGDVSPARHGEVEMEGMGRELAAAVRTGLGAAVPIAPSPFVVSTARVALPSPALSVRNCTTAWVPRWLRVPLGAALPAATDLTAGRLGDVAWVTIPGELQSRLGRSVKQAGRPGVTRVLVAGVSNDYLGYFLTPADYRRVTYVSCATLYGPEVGSVLTTAAESLIRRVAASSPRP
jgi:neutral/alkaline ceramidase-like enzyme